MQIKKEYAVIGAIFLITLFSRLYLSFQTEQFIDDSSYFNIRQIEHIRETGAPAFKDDLSYSGRTYIFLPLYHYIMAFFSLFMPAVIAVKIISNLFASSIVIIAFLLAFHISRNFLSSTIAGFASGFVPIFFSSTFASSTTYSFVTPLFLLIIYCFLKSEENKNYVYTFLLLLFLFVLLDSTVIFLIAGLLFYLLLINLEHLKHSRQEIEMIIFAGFMVLWFQFLFYKKDLLLHGFSIVLQNIPPEIINKFFTETNLLEMIYQIGFVPFIFGIYIIYKSTFGIKRKSTLLFIGLIISLSLVVWMRMIKPNIGLSLLGLMLIILFSDYLKELFEYIEKTRLSKFKTIIIASLLIAVVLTSAMPSVYYATGKLDEAPTRDELDAFEWIKKNAEKNDVILATFEEGHKINELAKRKNVLDDHFLGSKDAQQRYEDAKSVFITQYSTVATQILNKYDVNYIIFSERAKADFRIEELKIALDRNCFKLVYNSS